MMTEKDDAQANGLNSDHDKSVPMDAGYVRIRELMDKAEVISTGDDAALDTIVIEESDDASKPVTKKRSRGRPEGSKNKVKREKQSDQLMTLADDIELWRDEDRECYATFSVGDHRENWKIDSRQFKSYFTALAYDRFKYVPGNEAISSTFNVLKARAYSGPVFIPARRTGEHDGSVYIDLCDDAWQCVKVSPTGVAVISDPPVKFLRAPAMRPLPTPIDDPNGFGLVQLLSPFLNLHNPERDAGLVAAWIVAALRPSGPYPILILNGPQGSGKSSFSKFLRSIIDPSKALIRSAPKDERDIFVACLNGHVMALDNLSHVDNWLSDGLCRVATGGGFSTRALHTDSDEIVFDGARPIILNSIVALAERPDLGERSLTIELETIDKSKRETEEDFWKRFSEASPYIFGAACVALSSALRNRPKVRPAEMTRMADFCLWSMAAENALGYGEGGFMEAYQSNISDTADDTFEANLVATSLVKFLKNEPDDRFEGSASDLLDKLNLIITDATRKNRTWPQSPEGMGRALKRVSPILKTRGIVCESNRRNGARVWILAKMESDNA